MKNTIKLLIFLSLLGCTNSKQDNKSIMTDKNYEIVYSPFDTLSKGEIMSKYIATRKDTPIWIKEGIKKIEVEDYAETILMNEFTINHFQINDLSEDSVYIKLGFSKLIDKSDELTDILISKNKQSSLTRQEGRFSLANLSLKEYQIILKERSLNKMNITDYKRLFPGSYSVRNVLPDMSVIEYYLKNSKIENYDITKLFIEDKVISINWINDSPVMVQIM